MLPATPEAYEAMVEAMARAEWEHNNPGYPWPRMSLNLQRSVRERASAALAAIGIRRQRHAKGKNNK